MLKLKPKAIPLAIASLIAFDYSASVLAAPNEGLTAISEIVVNARKRDEKLQEVPEAISVLTEEMIEDAGVDDIRSLAAQMPNMTMNYSFRQSIIKINSRGFSTPQFGDAPVAYVVDGFAVTDLDFINQGIFDVENIQVLRGPQGALYGRGALQGAVLINTKQPTNEFQGTVKTTFQSGDDLNISGVVSGPLIEDKLFLRVGGYYQDRDGQIRNDLGDRLDFIDDYAVRATLKWLAAENLEVSLSARVSDGDYGTAQVIVDVPNEDYDKNSTYDSVNQDYVGQNEREISESNLKLDWDLGFANLVSLTSYSHLDDTVYADGDFSLGANGTVVQADYSERSSLAQEIRLTSGDDQAFRWMFGAVYQDRDWDRIYENLGTWGNSVDVENFYPNGYCNTCKPDWNPRTTTAALIAPQRESTDIGVFAHGSWDVTDKMEISAALRYDRDERQNTDEPTNVHAGFPAETELKETFSELQPKLSVSYQLTNDVLTYASVSRGFRSGGFNALDFTYQQGIYEQEVSETVEFGVKSSLWDGRATLNGAVFYSDAENYQRSLFDFVSNTLGIQNIHQVDISGFEVELQALLTDNLQFTMAYGYVDAKIDNFSDVDHAVATAVEYGELAGLSAVDIAAAAAAAEANAISVNAANNGNRAPYIPRYTLNMSLRHELALADNMDLVSYISFRQLGDINWEPEDNRAKSGPKETIDARVTLRMDQWSVAAFVENLLDERRPVDQFVWNPGVSGAVNPNKPRAYGLSVRYDF